MTTPALEFCAIPDWNARFGDRLHLRFRHLILIEREMLRRQVRQNAIELLWIEPNHLYVEQFLL